MKCTEYSSCSDLVLDTYNDITCRQECKASPDAKSCIGSLSDTSSCSDKGKDKCTGTDGSRKTSMCLLND
jgi:hypothetical protein